MWSLRIAFTSICRRERYSKAVDIRGQQDKAISATLFVTGQDRPSEMRYFKGYEEIESRIHLVWRLPDDQLAEFRSLVLAGNTPCQAFVSFPKSNFWESGSFQSGGLEFGWEPDGSGQKWDNEKMPAIPIENVEFKLRFQISQPDEPLDSKIPEDDRAFFSDPARVNFVLLRKLSAIESSMSQLSWRVGLIGLLVLALVLSRLLH